MSADGSVPLPPHALAALPPGSLLRVHEEDGRWVLLVEEEDPVRDPAVVCTGLVVRFGATTALDHVDLEVRGRRARRRHRALGCRQDDPVVGRRRRDPPRRTGSVVVRGTAVDGLRSAVSAGVAIVPQGNGLAAVLTAHENVLVPLLARGADAAQAPGRAAAALEAVGLAEVHQHLVEELSGGQQQRVAVARGLALSGPVLLADEPTSELDHMNREVVLRLLRSRADAGAAVVMATHDPEAAAAADRVVHLDDGVVTPG